MVVGAFLTFPVSCSSWDSLLHSYGESCKLTPQPTRWEDHLPPFRKWPMTYYTVNTDRFTSSGPLEWLCHHSVQALARQKQPSIRTMSQWCMPGHPEAPMGQMLQKLSTDISIQIVTDALGAMHCSNGPRSEKCHPLVNHGFPGTGHPHLVDAEFTGATSVLLWLQEASRALIRTENILDRSTACSAFLHVSLTESCLRGHLGQHWVPAAMDMTIPLDMSLMSSWPFL